MRCLSTDRRPERDAPTSACASIRAPRTRGVARTSRTTGASRTYQGYRSRAGVAAFGGTGFAIHLLAINVWRTVSMAEAVSFLRPPGDQAVEFDPDTPTAPVRDHDRQQLRCSFCQVGLGEGIGLTTQGFEKQRHRTTSSSFCSTRCRDCVLALAELHPSPLASDDFIARRALLTDRLLDLWRHGQGPDPALVLAAARTASSGLASADTA